MSVDKAQQTILDSAVEAARSGHCSYTCPMHAEVQQQAPGHCPKCGMSLEPRTPVAAAVSSTFTCPMHPQIILDEPGFCPICGMTLEPLAPGDDPGGELADMKRRFTVSVALTAPLLLLAMSDLIPGQPVQHALSPDLIAYIELALASPVVLWGGLPFLQRAWASITNRSLNMFTLIALGTGVAYLYSAIATFFPRLFPAAESGGMGAGMTQGRPGLYFEVAASITVLVQLGQVLELAARGKTSSAIKSLLALTPKRARLINRNGAETEVTVDKIERGDRLRVRPGERVPVDGIVVEGASFVDESLVTGEPMPAYKGPGDRLTGGSVNGEGSFVMEAQRVGNETLVAQIVRMVSEAQRSRAPIQSLADMVASYFVPAVVLAAAATFAMWIVAGPEPRFAHALINAVAVLIIACPCALGLATPMSIMVGIGRGAAAGVLIKNAEAIEAMEKVDTLVVDKTGTLSEGKPRLASVKPLPGWSESDLLRFAAAVEISSEHPLGQAIVAAARERGIEPPAAHNFKSTAGQGVAGDVNGRNIALGNEALLREIGAESATLIEAADTLRNDGQTVIFLAIDRAPAGLLGVADPIKDSTPEAVRSLHQDGIRIVMLTGDNRLTAQSVAAKLGIDEVRAGLLPQDKVEAVKRLESEGRIVAMAGDGVNDAPALAAATVGIAMGTG
ncbi:MAG TPA: copper-translocating P-type ATPase, partial [Blastocatellia bacterium]|nr:copper-translocating P-type ATPase [Blastocatellia bacterium]